MDPVLTISLYEEAKKLSRKNHPSNARVGHFCCSLVAATKQAPPEHKKLNRKMSSSHGILLQYVSISFQQKRMIQEVSQEKLLFSFSKFLTSNVLSVFECLLAGSPVKKHWVPLGMAG